jgi:hypothetical protein
MMMESIKPHFGVGIQIRINNWNIKSLPDEKKRDETCYPCALVSQKIKKMYRIYFDSNTLRSQWIVDILSAINGGFGM